MARMNIKREILAIEKRVHASGQSMHQFLIKAGVDDSLWSRWKHKGIRPLVTTWDKIERAVEKLSN